MVFWTGVVIAVLAFMWVVLPTAVSLCSAAYHLARCRVWAKMLPSFGAREKNETKEQGE